ncbi:MAG: hypothetical protein JWS12_64 [Candidatus Saccharibacteria bacterium]|nr:hypothetical protein [Candidatus Saccharibacteria bacterium]
MVRTVKKSKPATGWQKFVNALNPDTSSKRMLGVVLIFAVLGGSYFVYGSYAQSIKSVAYVSAIDAVQQPATVVAKSPGSKNSKNVWNLGPTGSIMANITLPYLNDSAPFQICATLKAAQAGTVNISLAAVSKGGEFPVAVDATNVYKKYCAPMTYLSGYTSSLYEPGVVNKTNGNVYVDSISFVYNSKYISYGTY